ncbi:hypothetical protein [Paenibacillus sp. GYB003]|uniref:hypothetical protein n=1 Tax=Paenibacillus sp. GYB003 TaxID=2994392 RepID=UPI002F969572
MIKSFIAKKAIKVALAAALVTGISVVSVPQKTHAMVWDCYHWFDFYYKVTNDLGFAERGYNVCLRQRY